MIIAGLLLAGTVTALFYALFYALSPWVYSFTIPVPLDTVTPWVRWVFLEPRDGIELYVAFIMMFLMMATAIFSYWLYVRIPRGLWRRSLIVAMVGICGLYFYTITFTPPMAQVRFDAQAFLALFLVCTGTFVLGHFFYQKRWTGYLLATLFFLLCAFPPVWFSKGGDDNYILGPAWRVLQGAPLNQTVFQYDHLLSFMGMLWIKLGFPIEKFHVVGDLAFFGLLIGGYYLARALFTEKAFAVYFAVSLAIIKLYGLMLDVTVCPQSSPLRLDWWIVILALVYFKGPSHWSLGLLLGGLMAFHHTFGTIYSLFYVLSACLFLVWEGMDAPERPWLRIRAAGGPYLRNFLFVAAGAIVYRLFLACGTETAEIYQKYGINFLPIDKHSFFWYLPLVFIMAILLLWNMRHRLPVRYVETGMCLVFLGVCNLIYFFGRSHENNLINIAASLWMLLFFVWDVILIRLRERGSWLGQRWVVSLLAVAMLGAVVYFYSEKIVDRVKAQVVNAKDISKAPPGAQSVKAVLNVVKVMTHGSPQVIFLSENFDFAAYYYGQYKIPDPYALAGRHLFMKEYVDFLNTKLSEGYYLIAPTGELSEFIDIIQKLKAANFIRTSFFLMISNSR